jgi:hypothetical protein
VRVNAKKPEFGLGGRIRRTILGDWLSQNGKHRSTKLVLGPGDVEPLPRLFRRLGESGAEGVTVDSDLDLRDPRDVARLHKRLVSLQSQYPEFRSVAIDSLGQIPLELPEGWSLSDFLGGDLRDVDSDAAMTAQKKWAELLAFYRSPRLADDRRQPWEQTGRASDWGIYVQAGGVESLAREIYLPVGFTHAEAIGLATADLMSHELQHASIDLTAIRLEAATGPLPQLGEHACGLCLKEEALGNAAAVFAARGRVHLVDSSVMTQSQMRTMRAMHDMAVRRLEKWATAGPPGYRDWAGVVDDGQRDQAIETVLAHDGVSRLVALDLYRGTTYCLCTPDVPIYLVKTPGSEAAAGKWTYEFQRRS